MILRCKRIFQFRFRYCILQSTIFHFQHILSVITMLENSGFEKLVTFCHGDAKPNNFLFRNIEVDIEGKNFKYNEKLEIHN